MPDKLKVKDLPDHLLALGRYTASSTEISDLLNIDQGAVRVGMNRLRKQQRVFSPARGLYAFVPPEYRSWGVLPAEWFIDDLMRHLERRYYVSLLTAAARHGASHQRPQVFQVIVDKPTPDRSLARVRLQFFKRRNIGGAYVESVNTPAGKMQMAAKETTVDDLVARPGAGGGFSNIATIIREIGPLDGDKLAQLSKGRTRAHARRLGWLVEQFSETPPDLSPLRARAAPEKDPPTPLAPRGPHRGRTDESWGLWINTEVEPDV